MAKKRRPFPSQEKNLDWYMEHWKEYCEVCKEELIVHSYRRGNIKWREAVYSHCENKSCRNQMMVVCVYLEEKNGKA